MKRHRKIYRLASLILLVIFLTTLSGLSAFAGHDCCGNCRPAAPQHPLHAETDTISGDCCAAKPGCTCTLQSTGGMELPVYSLVQVNSAGDNVVTGLAAFVSGDAPAPDLRSSSMPPRLREPPPGSRPIYLTKQAFLC
jgi:hypothetical protein